jgi:hypothetical protein
MLGSNIGQAMGGQKLEFFKSKAYYLLLVLFGPLYSFEVIILKN